MGHDGLFLRLEAEKWHDSRNAAGQRTLKKNFINIFSIAMRNLVKKNGRMESFKGTEKMAYPELRNEDIANLSLEPCHVCR